MGDRGDFEAPDDIYRGSGYRPPVQRGDGSIGLDEFKTEPPIERMMIYGSLALAFKAAPESLDDNQLFAVSSSKVSISAST